MTKLEQLRAALDKAEAALANAVSNAAKVGGDRTEANAGIENARAYCRRVHAVLTEVKHLEPTGRLGEELNIHIGELLDVAKRMPAAIPRPRQVSEHPVRAKKSRSQDESGRRKPAHRINIGFLALEPSPSGARARRSLIRQAIGLFALILAYLQYYYLDVQLQVMSLPSNFAVPLQ